MLETLFPKKVSFPPEIVMYLLSFVFVQDTAKKIPPLTENVHDTIVFVG